MPQCLSIGGYNDPFLARLLRSIRKADEIEFVVSFIKSSGLELLFSALADAIEIRGTRLTVLTSDYLDVTDPQALRKLMLLSERGADIRLFQSNNSQSFHLKAYIFFRNNNGKIFDGTAFIGSSNISNAALTDGIEWNYGVGFSEDTPGQKDKCFNEVRKEYHLLLNHPQVVKLDYDWIDDYEKRRKILHLPVAPGSNDDEIPIPDPNEVQHAALEALTKSREEGYQRGLVVMATGLGKTFLAAFDSKHLKSKRVLFVAHREEILLQAEATFQKIHPRSKVGHYSGSRKDIDVDMVFASVQTLGKKHHLDKFPPDYFDYMVVDEFHHAAAPTYRKLLNYFQPRFLLGLTATPERTDQSDILTLCDDNLVYTCNLFRGVEQKLLCSFTYYGIYDESVNYDEIPWRNSRFDPSSLSNKLATLARAKHALSQWREKGQNRTLAFCVSKKHADFMANRFNLEGIRSLAVHGGSDTDRSDALEQLDKGNLQVIFSVDLFNEGVDLPSIDTVMMLRPTESKVLFMQQLGRGLRLHQQKERLVVLDFIGNHQGFLNKPQALFGVPGNYRALAKFANNVKRGSLELPAGCFVNYDLEIIEFLAGLAGDGSSREYQILKSSLGRRPTLKEFYHSGASMQKLRHQYGNWWGLVREENDLGEFEIECLENHQPFLREVEVTAMNKSFKIVLLESILEKDGFRHPLKMDELAMQALKIFGRRRKFIMDIRKDLRDIEGVDQNKWLSYWKGNPVKAWTGGNKGENSTNWFELTKGYFKPVFAVKKNILNAFSSMLQELVDYRLAAYESRLEKEESSDNSIVPFPKTNSSDYTELPYFPNLRIACGHFREGNTDADEYRKIGNGHGRLDPSRHFIARAIGDSMNGGSQPVHDGDYLLLEHLDSNHAGSITGSRLVIERQDVSGDDQYLLRTVTKTNEGKYILKATNPDYADYEADEGMRTLAKLKEILDPFEILKGQEFLREEIPELFQEKFNPGNWHSGHIVLNEKNVHILLVTLNKQGKASEHRYHDYFIDDNHFHWQSQNSTTPESKRGKEIIEHEKLGITVHLFIRENKLADGKAAPFQYYGPVRYQKHEGSAPISVTWVIG